MQLTSQVRTDLKAMLSGQTGWSAYMQALPVRNNSGTPANTGNMLKDEWLAAADAFGIDMPRLADGVLIWTPAANGHAKGFPVSAATKVQTMQAVTAAHAAHAVANPSPDHVAQATLVPPPAAGGTVPVYAAPIGPDAQEPTSDTGEGDTGDTGEGEGNSDTVQALLAPLSGMFGLMSPQIKLDLEKSIAKALANRPVGSVQTRDVPVYIDSETGDVVPTDISNASGLTALNSYVQQGTLGAVFKTRTHAMQTMECAIWSGEDVPALNANYTFDNDILQAVFACLSTNKCAWLAGYAGTGKTDFVEQIAHKTGRGFTRICFHAESEVAPFVGQLVPDAKGGYSYRHGALTLAIQKPGEFILLDEVSSAVGAIQTWLQTILDKGSLVIPETGEEIAVAPGVNFLVADNTLGFGDDTGAHQGKALQDRAFLDRYAQFIWFDYPPAAKEAKIITAKTGLCLDASHKLVEYANMARAAVRKGDGAIAYPVTIRRLFAWAEGLVYGMESATVFKNALLNCAGPDYDGLKEIEKAHLLGDGHAAITALARGEALPVAPVVQTATGEAASGDFDSVNEDNIS